MTPSSSSDPQAADRAARRVPPFPVPPLGPAWQTSTPPPQEGHAPARPSGDMAHIAGPAPVVLITPTDAAGAFATAEFYGPPTADGVRALIEHLALFAQILDRAEGRPDDPTGPAHTPPNVPGHYLRTLNTPHSIETLAGGPPATLNAAAVEIVAAQQPEPEPDYLPATQPERNDIADEDTGGTIYGRRAYARERQAEQIEQQQPPPAPPRKK